MSSSKGSAEDFSSSQSARDSGDESEDSSEECEVLEYSPCGRWQKRREEVHQRDVPGIDSAFLAMDNDQGIEVVWNEVCISEKKSTKSQEEKIKRIFDNLIQIEHANIVKFHKYWADKKKDRHRVIFITEYMSSGSLKQFLKKTKKNNKTLKAWKRWCTQILSALRFVDVIVISYFKIAPDAIYDVKTYRQEVKNMHYIAPEYESNITVSPAVDIYSFGICALEVWDLFHILPNLPVIFITLTL
ncbi:hypothetical protein LSH36_694g01078 [Paralvinella palmiformis]|uniref:Protein kinase domain-containing protein n=1 Tax=Paralvinella palmiformis TaxID=53620 RepID=A0AAD9J3A8_9ANNE|nr:hypothetical protein LSH36_694g01078 [Paralvinella palmiformis]